MTLAVQLSLDELIEVLTTARVLQIMGEKECRLVTVDYVPAQQSMTFVREDDDSPLEAFPRDPIKICFVLEDAMVGGVVYAAVTVGHRVIIEPFRWYGYEHLAAACAGTETPMTTRKS